MNETNESENLINQQHSLRKKNFFCEFSDCNRSYTTAGNLKNHMKAHRGDFSYKCSTGSCQKSFRTKYALQLHERAIHTKVKPYICEMTDCEKSYNTLYRLKSHLRIHNGGLFKCEECGKQFTSNSDLRKHFRIHSGERPFKCGIDNCQSAFTASHHLQNHLVTHKNKPYKCLQNSCDKKFKSDISLKNHVKAEHTFKIVKNKTSDKQEETVQIQAIPTNITRSDTPQTSLNDLINLNNNLPDDLLDAEVIDQVNFDASKGTIQINSDYPVSTSTLNSHNLYDLLKRLQHTNQLQVENDSLTSQFVLTSSELHSLRSIETNPTGQENDLISRPVQSNYYSNLNKFDRTINNDCNYTSKNEYHRECQELCCVLKFNSMY